MRIDEIDESYFDEYICDDSGLVEPKFNKILSIWNTRYKVRYNKILGNKNHIKRNVDIYNMFALIFLFPTVEGVVYLID